MQYFSLYGLAGSVFTVVFQWIGQLKCYNFKMDLNMKWIKYLNRMLSSESYLNGKIHRNV